MKVFVRNVVATSSNNLIQSKIDPLDLSAYQSEIYKVDISIDVSSNQALFNNVKSNQTVIVNGKSVNISSGFYTLDQILSILNTNGLSISLITTESDAYHTQTSCSFDFSLAAEIREILGFDKNIISSGEISDNPANITRNMNVIQLYSSIVNSDVDTPIATIKINNPTVDFHETIQTKISLSRNVLNYIDIIFRDISGEIISLNAENITVTLFIKCYEEFDFLKDDRNSDCSVFNLTTKIPSLNNGEYNHKVERPLTLNKGKIINANFYINGKIKNLSSDQEIIINNVKYTIPAGSYSLEMLLALLNSKSFAVFSYIKSGKDAYKLQVNGCNHLEFLTPELANMLGFDVGIVDIESSSTVYQLRDFNHSFKLKLNGNEYGLFVTNGNYDEDGFFNGLLNAIKEYVPDCTMNKTEKYYEFKSNKTIEIHPADKNGIDLFYWSQNISRRNSSDLHIIPRVGYFYYNADVKFNIVQEYFETDSTKDIKDYQITCTYSNGTSKAYTIPIGYKSTAEDFYKLLVKNLALDTYFNITYHRSTATFTSKKGISVNFTGDGMTLLAIGFPYNTKTTSWTAYIPNSRFKGLRRKVTGDFIIYHKEKRTLIIKKNNNNSKI